MQATSAYQPSIADNAVPAAPYTRRPPSPPFIHIPPTCQGVAGEPMISMVPSFENVDSSQLTSHDLQIITRNSKNVAVDRAAEWSYEQRREAQALLDFLYIGPNSVIRDHDFLRREDITMIVVARDGRMASQPLASLDKAARALNIQTNYVDIDDAQQMISAFPSAIRLINDHLLSVYHSQIQNNGNQPFDPSSFRPGKVLIACETGNLRSAALAAAYMMTVFGKDMITTLQFICIQRFCCCFDEDVKRKLQSWEDLIRARSQVAATMRASPQPQTQPQQQNGKRHIGDLMDVDQSYVGSADQDMSDRDRFEGREAFAPFVDHS